MLVKQMITSIQQENGSIIFHFSCYWYQEDIEILSNKIFDNLPEVTIIENIEGADRVNIRFLWQGKYYYSLNFDYYSQSIWIEGEDETSNTELKALTAIHAVL